AALAKESRATRPSWSAWQDSPACCLQTVVPCLLPKCEAMSTCLGTTSPDSRPWRVHRLNEHLEHPLQPFSCLFSGTLPHSIWVFLLALRLEWSSFQLFHFLLQGLKSHECLFPRPCDLVESYEPCQWLTAAPAALVEITQHQHIR